MRNARAGAFLFEPRAFMYDPAVLAMTPAGKGAYIMLVCGAWDMPEPGVIEPATESVLASLAFVTVEVWRGVEAEVKRAFDINGDRWTQRRLVDTYQRQCEFVRRQKAAGRAGGKTRARNALRISRVAQASLKRASSPSGSGSVSVVEDSKETPLSAARTKARAGKEPEPDGFEAFWRAYPRREKRRAAARAYKQARERRPDWEPDDLRRAAEAFAADCVAEERERRYTPHPATWLNADAYLDQEAENDQGNRTETQAFAGQNGSAPAARGVLERLGLVDSERR